MSTPRVDGYGRFLRHDLRFTPEGAPVEGFALNRAPDASVLPTRHGFGSGSSREAAGYAPVDFGIRAVIAQSFGDIFAAIAANKGLQPARVSAREAEARITLLADGTAQARIDLEAGTVRVGDTTTAFVLDETWRRKPINGWNDIDVTLRHAEAIVAAASLVGLMISVVASVLMRNLGLQFFAWLFASAEYGLIYMAMLGAPWLVRERGHVHIELVTAALPPRLRRIVRRSMALACVAVSLILAWYGLQLFLTNIERNDFDVRACFYPRWLLTITFPIASSFMAIEFARFVLGPELLHSGEAGIHK